MSKLVRYVFFAHLLVFLAIVTACTGVHFPDQQAWKEVPITDIKRVAGKWEGITWTEPRARRQDDFIKVAINEEGHFEFSSYRMIGAWLGSGKLLLENSKLVTAPKPNAGNATFTLFEHAGKYMLKVSGTTKTGRTQAAELTPQQRKSSS